MGKISIQGLPKVPHGAHHAHIPASNDLLAALHHDRFAAVEKISLGAIAPRPGRGGETFVKFSNEPVGLRLRVSQGGNSQEIVLHIASGHLQATRTEICRWCRDEGINISFHEKDRKRASPRRPRHAQPTG